MVNRNLLKKYYIRRRKSSYQQFYSDKIKSENIKIVK